ncbi:MAG: WYL domain-containing transcriptional regulator [Pirellulaceae bacterium]
MARNEQLIRQFKILQILERYRYGRLLDEIRDDLVDELGLTSLHTRTVRRDIESLQTAGVDLDVEEISRGKVWKLGASGRGTHKISASATELLALSLGRDLMLPLAGTPFWIGVESFWSKIREKLPEPIWEHYQKFRQTLQVTGITPKNYAGFEGILKNINRSIQQHRVVEASYQSVGQPAPKQREIEPYGVVLHHSSIYVVAAAREVEPGDASRIRHWKLDRFKKAEPLDLYFKVPQDFDLQQHLAQSMGIFSADKPEDFQIRVSSFAAAWVREDPWHPDQKIETQADGSIILTVKAAHQLEIIPRVLALGPEAVVLSPQSCREAVAERVRAMAAAYADA